MFWRQLLQGVGAHTHVDDGKVSLMSEARLQRELSELMSLNSHFTPLHSDNCFLIVPVTDSGSQLMVQGN